MLKSSKTKNVINRSISALINLPEYNILILKAKHYFGKWRSYIFVPLYAHVCISCRLVRYTFAMRLFRRDL